MYSRHIRLPVGVAAVVLAVTASLYVSSGTPVPRPWYLFGGIALTLSALLFGVIRVRSFSKADILAVGSLATLTGGFLRFSPFITVITSGVDHTRWVRRVQSNIAANGITGTDMYASAPFYLLELGIGQRLLGLSAFETRFITLTIASLLPVVLGTFAYYLTDDARIGLIAALVAVPQFLFLRTSALLEAESLALLWYTLTMLLLVRYLQTEDTRHFVLFSGFLLTAVFLHFLYAVILFCTVVGTLGLLAIAEWKTPLETPISRDTTTRLAQGAGAAGLFIPTWILTSTYGGVAIDVLRSFFSRDTSDEPDVGTDTPTEPETPSDPPTGSPSDPPTGSPSDPPTGSPSDPPTGSPSDPPTGSPADPSPGTPPETPGTASNQPDAPPQGSGTTRDSGDSLLDSVADFILPQSGTVARSVGVTSGSSGETLLALFPLILFIGGGGIGGIITLIQRRKYDLLLIASLLTVGLMSVVGVFLDIQYELGYRLYYFVGVLLVVSVAIGIRYSVPSSVPLLVALLLVGIFLPYAVMGPMSPLGNNVDPQFGGTDWRFTQSEYDQLNGLDNQFSGQDVARYDVPQIPGHIKIGVNRSATRLTRAKCQVSKGKIADTGEFSLCLIRKQM